MVQITVLGGPDSGKTTYLGAVVAQLQDGATGQRFKIVSLPDDAHAVRQLETPLLEARYPVRTTGHGDSAHLSLELEPIWQGAPNVVLLTASDYAGEQVERLFGQRTAGWSQQWQDRAAAAALVLLLRPPATTPLPSLRRPMTPGDPGLSSVSRLFGPGLRLDHVPQAQAQEASTPVHMPTELSIIELMQFLRHVRGLAAGERPRARDLRVAVLVSAWDAVAEQWQDEGPSHYVQQNLALLDQYLWSNFEDDGVRFFGLSATGGDLNEPTYSMRYAQQAPGACGYVTYDGHDGPERKADLTLPLAWALFGDDAIYG